MKNGNLLVVSSAVLVIGLVLLSQPKCHKGCRTVAEHLVEHGIQDFLSALLA